jgi:phosphopantothenoylcysteine decarboxylase/phosphopantothenate--cysteine ligase
MGFALAEEAHRRGAQVTLVAGPTRLEPPPGEEVIRVRSAAEMHAAVMRAAARTDVVIMAAAVADYAPADVAPKKLAKAGMSITLTLQRTPDILSELAGLPSRLASGTPLLVGFAAETGDAVAKARAKRQRKQIDLIVANDVSAPGAGFDVSTNEVTIVGENREVHVPLQSKGQVARVILDHVEELLARRSQPAVPMSPA